MKKTFVESSYLSQVRRLRSLAKKALLEYPFKVKSIHFLKHGENATFRAETSNGQSFLIRIHRNDYHSKLAIEEELKWLSHLSKKGVSVPQPVRSKKGNLVETVEHADMGSSRNCSVLVWVPGSFLEKSIKPKHLFEVGQLLADFQNNTPKGKTKHRQYWTAEGMVGTNPKFGSIDKLPNVSPHEQKILTAARKLIFKKLKAFGKKYPQRMGLIHADLHFGNIVSNRKKLAAIDFDDCGYGFFAHDLVTPYVSVENSLSKKKAHLLPQYQKALIEGYKSKRKWDKNDEEIFRHLITARKLMMLGWLNSRSDNPRLKKYLKGAVKNVLEHLKNC